MRTPPDQVDGAFAPVEDWFRKTPPAERQGVQEKVERIVNDVFDRMDSVFAGPEDQWTSAGGVASVDDQSDRDVAGQIANLVLPTLSQLPAVAVKERIQLRLLRLHTLILAYRWEHGHLPKRLEDVVPFEETMDPASRQPFQYSIQDRTYRLSSAGALGTGPVELKYRQTFSATPDLGSAGRQP